MRDVEHFLNENGQAALERLRELLRIPSVSADARHNADTRGAAEWLLATFRDAGLTAEVVETAGHPIVYAEWTEAAGKPTVLVYGHYDVQPPDPLDEWTTPPFEPDVRDGHVYARGATDDKGQMLTHVLSAAAWLKVAGRLPVNVKFVVEGEEEVGSDNLDRFLADQKDRLACDVVVVSDTSQYAPDMPAITYGLRGIAACEVTLRGPKQDLHSGMFGGSVTNPANALAGLIASLHDDEGRVAVAGFYDDVRAIPDEERQRLAELPFDERRFLEAMGTDAPAGEADFTTLERRWCRPTCDVNGLVSGYTGEGPKTIVPAWAKAKLSCRLVPDQDPSAVVAALESHFRERLPPGVRLEFETYHGCRGVAFDTSGPHFDAARKAIEAAFGTAPVLIREGGSIPIVTTFEAVLGVDTLLLGWGQDTDNLHSPNERFSVEDFHRGTLASARLWQELSSAEFGVRNSE